MKKILFTSLILFIAVSITNAQFFKKSDEEIYKKDIASQARELIQNNLDLTEDQSKVFWPLYDEFEVDAKSIVDAELQILEEYLMNYYTISDKKAKELTLRLLELRRNRIDLHEEYLEKMSEVLPAKVASKFIQIANRLYIMRSKQDTEKIPLLRDQDKQ